VAVFERHPHQLADHDQRQRVGERRDHIEGLTRLHGAQEVVEDLGDVAA
jgi:hypothetical protein